MEPSLGQRPWEAAPPHPQSRTLPSISTLTRDVDQRPIEKTPLSATSGRTDARDSAGSWTGTSGIRSSTHSNNTMPYLNSSTTHSPSLSHPPDTVDGPSLPTSGFSSAQHSAHPSHSFDPLRARGSADLEDPRRDSVDSRIHQGFDSLRLGPTSPYNASANASQSSLASSLQHQRGIQTNGLREGRYSAGAPISPLWPRGQPTRYGPGSGSGSASGSGPVPAPGPASAGPVGVAPRIAPPILETTRSEHMYAAEPVRGQPYAFPDPDAGPTRSESNLSRRNSFASSFTNTSIYSDMNRALPPGQHELPEHHHHTGMPSRDRVNQLKGDPDSPNSVTPYSRTPELRVTHKLAERKRRSEMKDCFEQLRAKLPANQNNKSSKGETLARAIDYISQLEAQNRQARVEVERQRTMMRDMETQMKDLNPNQRLGSTATFTHHTSTVPTSPLSYGSHYPSSRDGPTEAPRTLPPIMNGAMQGIQYGDERR